MKLEGVVFWGSISRVYVYLLVTKTSGCLRGSSCAPHVSPKRIFGTWPFGPGQSPHQPFTLQKVDRYVESFALIKSTLRIRISLNDSLL